MTGTAQNDRGAIASQASKKGWSRPFTTLSTMTPEEREAIRQTLRFDWDKLTRGATESNDRAERESFEIIDCHIRGVAARLHTLAEQVNPKRYLTWRESLMRVLDMLNVTYKATDTDAILEQYVFRAYVAGRRKSARAQTSFPTAGANKLGKTPGLVLAILKDVGELWDDLLGSEDMPAVATVFAICAKGQEEPESPKSDKRAKHRWWQVWKR